MLLLKIHIIKMTKVPRKKFILLFYIILNSATILEKKTAETGSDNQ